MAKSQSRRKASKRLESFNKSQEIYKVLEKGIIESEALMSTSGDRPEDDAHILNLLESTTGAQSSSGRSGKARPRARRSSMNRKKRR